MRCEEIRTLLVDAGEGGRNAAVDEHLAVCVECRSCAADAARIQAGFRLLAAEETPALSWGFAERVLRRLAAEGAARSSGVDFFEKAGRQVIMATLVLVLTLVLAMILPSSGPVRRQPTAVAYWPQSSAISATNFPVDWGGAPPLPSWVGAQAVVDHEAR